MRENLGRGRELIAPKFNLCDEKFKRFRDRRGRFAGSGEPKTTCRFCGSANVVKSGFNPTKYGWKQRYLCKDCLATFTRTPELVKGNKFGERCTEDIERQKVKGLKRFCDFVRRTIYPALDFGLFPQATYDSETFLDLLTHLAVTHDFAENGSKTFKFLRGKGPSADDLLWHIEGFDVGEVEQKFIEVLKRVLTFAQPLGLSRRKRFDVAIDVHDWLWYGKPAPGALRTRPKRGTSRAFKFISLSVLHGGFRFVLLALPLEKQREFAGKVEELLRFATRWIKIRRVYLDGEFYQLEVIRVMKSLGLNFVVRAPVRTKGTIARVRKTRLPAVLHHTMKTRTGKIEVKLVVVKGKRRRQCFATNLGVTHEDAERLAEAFGKRWGIETSYRVLKDFRPKTASPERVVRFFLFMFSVCLHDCWVLANMSTGKLVLKFIPNKPFVTAKLFAIVLYAGPGPPVI